MRDRFFTLTDKTAVETAYEDLQIIQVAFDGIVAAHEFVRDRYRELGKTTASNHEMEVVVGYLYEAKKDADKALALAKDRANRVGAEEGILTKMDVDKDVADRIIKSGLFMLDVDALKKTAQALEKDQGSN